MVRQVRKVWIAAALVAQPAAAADTVDRAGAAGRRLGPDSDDRFAGAVRRKLLLEIAGGPAPRSG